MCRALAAVRVPTISAVGHETDISLTDLVADVPERPDEALQAFATFGVAMATGAAYITTNGKPDASM